MHTIGHAAALTGIPAATLRAWERRYGLVRPVRTESGYRLYDDHALQLLRAMGALVAGGWSPSQAAEHLRSDAVDGVDAERQPWEAYLAADTTDGDGSGATTDRADAADPAGEAGGAHEADRPSPAGEQTPPGPPGPWDIRALAEGAAALDPAAVGRAVDEAFAAGPLEQVVDSWLMPALHVLGAQWRAGVVDVAGEHVVSAIVHQRLGAAMAAAEAPPGGPRVAVGLARGSRHELGTLAFAVVLRRAGFDVTYLGADLPTQDWAGVVQRHRPDAVVIGVPTASDVLAVRDTVAALRAADPGLTVHVGGGAQHEVGHGTAPLGHSLTAAAGTLAAALR
jgi:DNA-binding transcriptional MerR regulator/methanogenic corrinoid protein MtbC1